MEPAKDKTYIFDQIRKKRILLTPEEEVRQQIISFLMTHRGFPQGLISVEAGLTVNGLSKRCDILIYGRDGHPLLLIECKAKSVNLSQSTFDQVARYNIALRVPWLIITNGNQTYCAKVDFEKNDYAFHPDIPPYDEL